jgi:hypothetical protein
MQRSVTIPVSQKCDECDQFLLTRKSFIFPCSHLFHSDCLVNRVLKLSSSRQARRINDLVDKLTLKFDKGLMVCAKVNSLFRASWRVLWLVSVRYAEI